MTAYIRFFKYTLKHTMWGAKRPYLDRSFRDFSGCHKYYRNLALPLLQLFIFSISVVSLVNFQSYKSQISFSFPKMHPHPLFLPCLMKAEDSPFLLITEKTKTQSISSLKSPHFYLNKLLAHLFLSIREFSVKIKRQTFFLKHSLPGPTTPLYTQ